jgi:hypothetical protein
VRRGIEAFGGDFLDHGQCALARRAAGAVGDGKEFRLQHRQPLAHVTRSFSTPSSVCGGKNSIDSSMLIMRS